MGFLDFSLTDSIGVLILMVGVVVAYLELKRLGDQAKENTYFEYSRRYNEIARTLPPDIFESDFLPSRFDQDAESQRAMKGYLDLCSEEVKLACRGTIPSRVWQDWEEEIRVALTSPAGVWARKHFDLDREYKTLRLYLDGKENGLELACAEYKRTKTWSKNRFG